MSPPGGESIGDAHLGRGRQLSPLGAGDCPAVALTIGKFDGVHAGHRHILAYLAEAAHQHQASSAALVLHPDPVTVLSGQPVGQLASLAERMARLRDCGVALVEPLHFTREVAELDPEMFIARLTDRFALRAVVVGSDFAFGYNRTGNLERLRQIAASQHFAVVEVPPLIVRGGRVSSRRIRSAVAAGDIELARLLLRRPPRFRGTVVHGVARGRRLGYPTANIDPEERAVLPADGVYLVRAEWQPVAENVRHQAFGLLNIGVRPTFDHGPRVVEVHLLDVQADLYGCAVIVELLGRLRGEQRFREAAELVAQLEADAAEARRRLAEEMAPRFEAVACEAGGHEVTVRGWDLAELLENAALAAGQLLSSRPCAERRPLRREQRSSGDDGLWESWLRCMAAIAGPRAQAMVYHAGEGWWHALWLMRCTDEARPVPGLTSVQVPRPAGGLLEARFRLTA